MSDYEKKLLEEASKGIAQNIKSGEDFARSKL
jgi:hypothetical protein